MPVPPFKATTVGGGTGSYALLRGLKNFCNPTAIIGMWDDEGDTGRQRKNLHVSPPGDVRQALRALMPGELRQFIDFLDHRPKDGPLEGAPWGNTLLARFEQFVGSNAEAVDVLSKAFNIQGKIIPVSGDDLTLGLITPDGRTITGEGEIGERCGEPDANGRSKRYFQRGTIPQFFFEPPADADPKAARRIVESDMTIIASGKQSSVGPHFTFEGIARAMIETKGVRILVCNLMTLPGMTDDFTVADHVRLYQGLVANTLGRKAAPVIDYVLFNTGIPTEDQQQRYKAKGEELVRFNPEEFDAPDLRHCRPLGFDLLDPEVFVPQASDPLGDKRALVRHSPKALANAAFAAFHLSQLER